MSIKLRQDLPGSDSNSTGLQNILGVEFGVGLEIWSDKCMVGQSANLGILNIWGNAVKGLHSSNSKGQRGFYNYLGVFLKLNHGDFVLLVDHSVNFQVYC